MVKELELNTTIMAGNLESFQAAFSRSVLGVTYKKFKRYKKAFYDSKTHNERYTKKAFEYLFLKLREQYKENLGNYNLRVNYFIEWDDYGKILCFKNLNVNIYLSMGKLIIDKLSLEKREELIKIDLFYSDFDAGSKIVNLSLEKIINEFGKDKFQISKHNIIDDDYKKIANIFNVGLIPSVQIDEIKIENPNENQIKDAIIKSLDEGINSVGTRLEESKEALTFLSQISQK